MTHEEYLYGTIAAHRQLIQLLFGYIAKNDRKAAKAILKTIEFNELSDASDFGIEVRIEKDKPFTDTALPSFKEEILHFAKTARIWLE